MLIAKIKPVGIDWYIQKIQTRLHDGLVAIWNNAADFECYGRAYRNKTDDGYKAEVFNSPKKPNQYIDVYWDNILSAISFFGVGETKLEIMAVADIHLVMFVNLEKIKGSITHRADEEIHQDVLSVLGPNIHGFKPTSVITGIENVLREYNGSIRDEQLKFIDMHPIHCFRISGKLTYDINKIC